LNFNDKFEELLISLIVSIGSAVAWDPKEVYEMGVACWGNRWTGRKEEAIKSTL